MTEMSCPQERLAIKQARFFRFWINTLMQKVFEKNHQTKEEFRAEVKAVYGRVCSAFERRFGIQLGEEEVP